MCGPRGEPPAAELSARAVEDWHSCTSGAALLACRYPLCLHLPVRQLDDEIADFSVLLVEDHSRGYAFHLEFGGTDRAHGTHRLTRRLDREAVALTPTNNDGGFVDLVFAGIPFQRRAWSTREEPPVAEHTTRAPGAHFAAENAGPAARAGRLTFVTQTLPVAMRRRNPRPTGRYENDQKNSASIPEVAMASGKPMPMVVPLVERAFQLAHGGELQCLRDVAARLTSEGYLEVDDHMWCPLLRQQLRCAMSSAQKADLHPVVPGLAVNAFGGSNVARLTAAT